MNTDLSIQKWYYEVGGGHTHIRVFMNGGKAGDLCFRNEEFEQIVNQHNCLCNDIPLIEFIDETGKEELECPEMPQGKLVMGHILKNQPRLK